MSEFENKVAIGTTITLDLTEQLICKAIANKRYQNARDMNVKNSKMGGQSNEQTDLEGISSELAFCKLFNVYPDLTVQVRSSAEGTDDGDAVLRDGRTVDVKSTKYHTGRLLAVRWKKPKVDFFALMIGSFPTYTFKGFMKSEELLKEQRIGNLGHGNGYIAVQHELKPLETI